MPPFAIIHKLSENLEILDNTDESKMSKNLERNSGQLLVNGQ